VTPKAKSGLCRWLDNVFLHERPSGRVVAVALMQAHAGGGESTLYDWAVTDKSEVDSLSIVQEAEPMAEDDAQNFGGTQRYCLVAYFGAARTEHQRSPAWAESVHQAGEHLIAESEPATEKGMRAQQMRHNEAILKIALGSVQQTMAIQARTIDRLAEQNEELQAHRLEGIKVVERMLSQEGERRIAQAKAEAGEKRKERAFEQIQMLAPVVINKLAGTKLLPEGAAGADVLKRLLTSITPEQLAGLQKVLTPQQTIAVVELWEQNVKPPEEP
jgi:hypothetical protein